MAGFVDVKAEVIEDRFMLEASDPADYSGPLDYNLYVKIRYHREDGTVEEAGASGDTAVEIGSSGMDPITVHAREVLREEMYKLLAQAAKKLRRHVKVSHREIIDAAEGPIRAASGESS